MKRRRARHVGAGLRVASRAASAARWRPRRQQLVPGGVELDLVDAVAVAVVGLQLRRVLVRLEAELDGAGAAAELAHGGDPVLGPVGALAIDGLLQHRFGLEQVVVDQRRGLVSPRGCGLRSVLDGAMPSSFLGGAAVSGADCANGEAGERGDHGLGVAAVCGGERGPTIDSPMAPTSAAAVASVSWSGSSPLATPSLEDLGEDVAVALAEVQALGLDRRVDRLGEQCPREAAAGERATREGLGHRPRSGRRPKRRRGRRPPRASRRPRAARPP